jgi:hypothetical protein
VQASNGDTKEGNWSSGVVVITMPAKSEPVNLTIDQNEISLDSPYNTTAVLNWRYPCQANGDLLKFEIRYNFGVQEEREYEDVLSGQYNYSFGLELNPSQTYDFAIIPVADGDIWGNEVKKEFMLRPGSK